MKYLLIVALLLVFPLNSSSQETVFDPGEIFVNYVQSDSFPRMKFMFDNSENLYGLVKKCEWDFGDGDSEYYFIDNQKEQCVAKHEYEKSGFYTVTLTLTMADDVQKSYRTEIEVEDISETELVVKTSFTEGTAPFAFVVDFSDTPGLVENIIQIRIDFGDGGVVMVGDPLAPVTHIYETPGEYVVTIRYLDVNTFEIEKKLKVLVSAE